MLKLFIPGNCLLPLRCTLFEHEIAAGLAPNQDPEVASECDHENQYASEDCGIARA
jgi:hypothetical protein